MLIARSLARFSSTGIRESTRLSKEMIQQLLRQGTPTLQEQSSTQSAVVEFEEKPSSIFDLNKSRLDDILQYFSKTGDIQMVNEKFGLSLTDIRYGLPIPNIDPGIKGLEDLQKEIAVDVPTPVENLYRELGITADTDFEGYQKAIQTRFNFSELLGEEYDEKLLAELNRISIPEKKLKDEKFMAVVRKTYSINLNLPGCIEIEDPNRFLPYVRPIEEFRHTPLIPISDREMKAFEERKAKRKQNMLYINASFEKFSSVALFCTTGFLIFYLFKLFLKKEEDMMVEYYKTKIERITGTSY